MSDALRHALENHWPEGSRYFFKEDDEAYFVLGEMPEGEPDMVWLIAGCEPHEVGMVAAVARCWFLDRAKHASFGWGDSAGEAEGDKLMESARAWAEAARPDMEWESK